MSHKRKYSCHHEIPKNHDDGTRFTEKKENKIILPDSTHVNRHRVFSGETPQQQLLHVLQFNKQILNDEFVKELLKVLDRYIYNYYKIETHMVEELWSLLELEKEYFSTKQTHDPMGKNNPKMKK